MAESHRVVALRGATTVTADDPKLIHEATREMLDQVLAANDITTADIISAVFSATQDLSSVYPAAAARAGGWADVPMLCVAEMYVAGSLQRCLRVILHVSLPTGRAPKHIYLHNARGLRPDWLDPS